MAVVDLQPAVGSPTWWVNRLQRKLEERRAAITILSDYYEGDHPLPHAPEKAAIAFRRMLRQSRANWCGLVVDAVAERLRVEGFRTTQGDETADEDAWRYWQDNQLDSQSELVHTEALVCGVAYVCVWPDPDIDEPTPLITPEHPSEVIHEYVPGRHRRLGAALKVWADEWTGDDFATLYLPDRLWKFRRRTSGSGTPTGPWAEREESIPNPLDAVPVVVFENRPRLLTGGRSEIEDVLDIQDRINKTLFDRLMASEFAAFRQRWATGMEIPTDANGQPIEPFKAAIDRLWIAEDPEVSFGEFDATDLRPYIDAVESDVTHMAAITKTPPHYLLGSQINVSGDALKTAESGLTSKARARCRHYGEAWERTMRLAFAVIGDARANEPGMETVWADPEYRTEGELVDALLKMRDLGVPLAALWERWGATQAEIRRWQEILFQEQLTAQAANLGNGMFGAEMAATQAELGGAPAAPAGEEAAV